MEIVPIIAISTTMATIVLITYILRSSQHKERMAMIEKGYDASLLKPAASRDTGKYSSLKWGIASVGVGIGLLLGHIVEMNTGMPEEGAYFSMIFLFGGLGLVIYYMIVRRQVDTKEY